MSGDYATLRNYRTEWSTTSTPNAVHDSPSMNGNSELPNSDAYTGQTVEAIPTLLRGLTAVGYSRQD